MMAEPSHAADPVARAVVWCVERLLRFSYQPACNRCGHGQYFHRLDDATNVDPTDPAAEFRCVWPMPDGPPVRLCDCPDYLESSDTSGVAGR